MIDGLENLAHIGDAGLAVAVLVTVIAVVWAIAWSSRAILLAWIESGRERSKREHERELQRQRNQHDQEMAEATANQAIADALQSLKKRMETDANRQDLIEATTRSLIVSAKQLSELIETATERMSARAQQTAAKLNTIQQGVDNVHKDVKTVPAEVWRIGDPKFDGVIDILAGMESRLLAQLQPGADVARGIIRDEFGDLISRIRVIVEHLERSQSIAAARESMADSVDQLQIAGQDTNEPPTGAAVQTLTASDSGEDKPPDKTT